VVTPERGFSSAKFLPGSHDSVVVALKSEENAAEGTQRTFITVYGEKPGSNGAEWRVLLDEVPLPIAKKFEGVEVIGVA
jgi:soluble calcium-activated nucleotidase 1